MNNNQALIIVDVQQGFLNDYTRKCLPRIHQLIQEKSFQLIIATRFYNPEGSPFRKFMKWNKLATPAEIDLDDVVEKAADFIIDKQTYGAGVQIAKILKNNHIKKATLVGIDTDVCVLQNAAYLFDCGFEITVDTKGCATNGGAEADKAAFKLLQRTVGRDFVL